MRKELNLHTLIDETVKCPRSANIASVPTKPMNDNFVDNFDNLNKRY
jgi:hypothetical protein